MAVSFVLHSLMILVRRMTLEDKIKIHIPLNIMELQNG
jgi:hypothetical protein